MYDTRSEKPLTKTKPGAKAGQETKVPQVLWIVPIHFVDAGRGVPDQTFAPGLGPDVNAIYPLRDIKLLFYNVDALLCDHASTTLGVTSC